MTGKIRKRKELVCLNYVPLKSLEKEGLEAKLIGTKRFETHQSYEFPFEQERRLAAIASKGTNAKGYRLYWRNLQDFNNEVYFEPINTITYGTCIVKLYSLKAKK